jgi:mannose-6-phosphate isomerase-like protein (cupin superfamily)
MKPGVRRADERQEFETPENCWILEIANDEEDEGVSISRARVPPGITTEWHKLKDTDERYVILFGCGRVEIGGNFSTNVQVGDVVRIPANIHQRVTNIGQNDLVFYCICTPRYKPNCYVTSPDHRNSEERSTDG